MAYDVLKIDGVAMPTPAQGGVTVSREKIWSANTGRSSSGKMVGTIVAAKTTISVKFPPLTLAQAKKIENAVSKEWLHARLERDGEAIFDGEVYGGTPTYTIYSMAQGMVYAQDMEVSLIER